ncbi:GIY-YIG nuclease family protein [Solemya velum gill symbiont]|uniref:GIY-YIG nuclease family protein n=1 Tax=Solemya velum gill symbiont TaxID=2340 RepID=UPI0009972C39|nr:GIY-YIG nuclease family protein [Solemya velum gill symbiont]OOY72080.1 hypothetical protein BOW09_12260 [Solemya velum gill symbiont]
MRPEQIDPRCEQTVLLDEHSVTINPKIINLSLRKFDEHEISLLEKGFKFTPDVQKFCRKLRLREFFGYDTSTDNSLVRNKSNWAPNRGRDSHLDCFIDTITKFPVTNSKNFKQNISKAEQRALEKLKQDETIVIKEADKGGAIVIMDKDYYREKVLDQLNDGIFYKKHSGKKTVMKKIKHLIEHHPNSVTEKEADYLCNFQIKDSNFYGLPKVHKSSEIITAVEEQKCSYIEVHRPKDLKLRPIVAGPESETQRLSHFLDLILKPICEKIPSFVRDDMDFLNHIPPEVPDSTILASFDVTSLYTNIPHDLGLTAANFWIEKHRDLVDRRFKTDFLLSALQIVLEGNTFNFDGQTYEQMKGTAMGTKVAPTYANLVMGYLEYKLYEKVKDEFDDDFKQYILEQWKRFLDDCFIFWKKSKEDLHLFHSILNSLHESIQFTMDTNDKELPFLDILVKLSGTKITTDIYYKNTDTHQYLNFNSCHPSHIKRNIPYCMARRVCAIVIEEEIRNTRLHELKSFLMNQQYPRKLIEDGIRKAKELSVEQLRQTKTKNADSTTIPLVTTHNPGLTDIYGVAKSNLPILFQSEKMKQLVKAEDIIKSRRQPRNLKKYLTRAKFETKESSDFSVEKCGDSRCGTCYFLETGKTKTFKNGKIFHIRSNMTCKSRNLIYCITCPTCDENYIGQTGNSLCERVRVHKQQIKHPHTRQIPLSEHLDICGAGSFKIIPIYKCRSDDSVSRLQMERYFTQLFRPKLNER